MPSQTSFGGAWCASLLQLLDGLNAPQWNRAAVDGGVIAFAFVDTGGYNKVVLLHPHQPAHGLAGLGLGLAHRFVDPAGDVVPAHSA